MATYPRWKELGRYVRKGEKAITLCQPVTCKRAVQADDDGDEPGVYTRFIYRRHWFVLAQTEGEELPPAPIPALDRDRALAALDVAEVPFDTLELAELRRYVEARGWSAVEYVDKGVSGAKDRRPALDRMMVDAKRRTIDAVVVWRLDRFGRNLRHLVTAIEELNATGVTFISLGESIDTSSPSGRLPLGVLGSFAEFERERLRERVLAGLHRATSEGMRLGRPKYHRPARTASDGRQTLARGRRAHDRDLPIDAEALASREGRSENPSEIGVTFAPDWRGIADGRSGVHQTDVFWSPAGARRPGRPGRLRSTMRSEDAGSNG